MLQTLAQLATKQAKDFNQPQKTDLVNLSKYFPAGTVYFYSFPAGDDSSFYNAVPPWKEELVAARPLVSGGNKIKVVTFASALKNEVWDQMTQDLGVEMISKSQAIGLPEAIHPEVTGTQRNSMI